MSDTSPTPIPTTESPSSPTAEPDQLSPSEVARVSAALAIGQEQANEAQPSAPDVAPADPPPASDAAPAGAQVPPAGAASEPSEPGAVAPPAIEESQPLPAGVDPATLTLVDSPEAAIAALGEDAGIKEIPAAGEPGGEEHPYETLQRLRTKLAAYGEECLKTVQPEIEYLMQMCDPAADHT